jgi:hypothetical protein
MMHSTYDVQRILDWIAKRPNGEKFTRDTVINQLAPISFSLVDYILGREVEKGVIYNSKPTPVANIKPTPVATGLYYMKKDSSMMSDTEKRLSDLEVKYKWLEGVVAEMHVPEKKRLWQRYEYVPSMMMPLIVDVMLANGEVLLDMPYRQVAWKNYPDDPTNVIAWREAK